MRRESAIPRKPRSNRLKNVIGGFISHGRENKNRYLRDAFISTKTLEMLFKKLINMKVAGGCIIGGICGGVVGYLLQGRVPTEALGRVPTEASKDVQGRHQTPSALSSDLKNNLEKMRNLSSPQGVKICNTITDLCEQISVAANLATHHTEFDPSVRLIVNRTCGRLSSARQLLDKLYTVERSRAGSLEEFSIYKNTVQAEIDALGSCLNNYITKHLLES